MGDFRVTVDAVGGHGCQRDVPQGGTVVGCGALTCPDCITGRYIAALAKAGVHVKTAKLQHWPDTTGEVLDSFDMGVHGVEVQPRIRSGNF